MRGVFQVAGDMGIDLGEAVRRLDLDTNYIREFRAVYGRGPDAAGLLTSLVAFERSLTIDDSRFRDYYLGGNEQALTPFEVEGWRLFRDMGCAGCHPPVPDPRGSGILAFSDERFHNLGIGYAGGWMQDVGRAGVTRRAADWGAFRTPSLLNVALTAPYMHDGSLESLEAVVAFYDSGGNHNPNLDVVIVKRGMTPAQRVALVAFLRSLTTEWLGDSAATARRLFGAVGEEGWAVTQ